MVHDYCKSLVNQMNALYMPLNIFIALTGIEVWTNYDEIEFTGNSTVVLEQFATYRKNKLLVKQPHDNAILLTLNIFDKQVAG